MTELTKNLTRVSTATDEDGRKLVITLNAEDQSISIKPKGRTAKAEVSMDIKKLYTIMRNVHNV
jgi:hypothetical protein